MMAAFTSAVSLSKLPFLRPAPERLPPELARLPPFLFGPKRPTSGRPTPPTTGMVAFTECLAKDKRASLQSGYDKDFELCRCFLDQHAGR
jgi:hypothetical protein